MKVKAAFVALSILIISGPVGGVATACDGWSSVDKRQMNQARRIAKGLNCGELTLWEYERLMREQWRIEEAERRAWADGRLSRAEKRRLHRLLDRASRHIYRARHNRARVRPAKVVCWPLPPRPQPIPSRPRWSVCPPWPNYQFSGFMSEPSWVFGWSITIP